MKDAVARCGVVRLLDPVHARKIAPDRCLFVIVLFAGEHEIVVGDSRLTRIDDVAARDLIERVDRKRRRAVGCGQ